METEHHIIIPDTSPQTLIILIGLPGCGKSTFAKTCINQHDDWVHLSSDNIRFNENITDNQTVFDLMYQRTKRSLKDKKKLSYMMRQTSTAKNVSTSYEISNISQNISSTTYSSNPTKNV